MQGGEGGRGGGARGDRSKRPAAGHGCQQSNSSAKRKTEPHEGEAKRGLGGGARAAAAEPAVPAGGSACGNRNKRPAADHGCQQSNSRT